MKARSTFLLAQLVTGFCFIAVAVATAALGYKNVLVAALLGGALGVFLSVSLAVRFGWLPPAIRENAIPGGLAGFALAVLVAILNLHTPLTPIASFALVGAGVLLGAGFAHRG